MDAVCSGNGMPVGVAGGVTIAVGVEVATGVSVEVAVAVGAWFAVGEGMGNGVGEPVDVGAGEVLAGVGEGSGGCVTVVGVAIGVRPGVASGLGSGGDVGVGASIFAVGVAGSSPVEVGVEDVVAEVQAINVAARDKLSQMIGLLQVENVIPIRHLRAIVELTRNRQFS